MVFTYKALKRNVDIWKDDFIQQYNVNNQLIHGNVLQGETCVRQWQTLEWLTHVNLVQ